VTVLPAITRLAKNETAIITTRTIQIKATMPEVFKVPGTIGKLRITENITTAGAQRHRLKLCGLCL